ICPAAEIAAGSWQCFDVDRTRVVIFNLEGQFHAIDDCCPHRGGPLSQGFLEGAVLYCPLHGWPFDVRTGQMPGYPELRVPTYPVKVENGFVLVAVDSPSSEPSGLPG
ncbi:MAG: non-heme iron oxygenase ferredoxin subunit, partial [Cyanobacteria bacterium REEB65]|nr:non-heme iron oxygenase ferredoxin subunit [Cyanobacteria bacterium REEB65]